MLPRRVVHGCALAGIVALMPAARPFAGGAHEVHLTHARLLVDGGTAVARIRFFEDDLARALATQANGTAPLPAGAALDSMVARYVATRFVVTADGRPLATRLSATGRERDAASGQPMRWIILEMRATGPIHQLVLRNALLFDTFSDQQNIVAAMRMPGERRQSLYFVAGSAAEQRLK